MIVLFTKAICIGLAIAAPVGPIGLLCINRSLHHGFLIGLMTGCGAAIADGIYGAIAAFGITSVSHFLISYQTPIRLIGGIFLIYLSIKIFFQNATYHLPKKDLRGSYWGSLLSAFFLTITNPMTILSFVAIFSGIANLNYLKNTYFAASLFVLGIILGSFIWWVILSSSIASFLKRKMNTRLLGIINIFSGFILLGFGIQSLLSLYGTIF